MKDANRDVADSGQRTCPSGPSEPGAERDAVRAGEAPGRLKTPLWSNVITIAGAFLASMAVMLLLTFGLFSLVMRSTNPYVDIIGYLILPGLLAIGLIAMPAGILLRSWRLRRRDPRQRIALEFPRIDLSDPSQRNVLKFIVGGTFVFLPVVGVSSYHGYHYTDSTAFCARVCHSVMEPQATTYALSGHARVPCAECHIGSGASWFVKSKLSGTRQVIAVWRDSYSRPIPPAIAELRPARETCEECHWPKKFFGAQLKKTVHFSSDEANTRREINVLLKTGGGDPDTGHTQGIHVHTALAGRIEYIAGDAELQEIPWVKFINDAGVELIYRSDGRPATDPRPDGIVRRMDCMDCHNRPAHRFLSPQEVLDEYLEMGRIDTTLPFVKREGVAALVRPYLDVNAAEREIDAAISGFYQTGYSEVWESRRKSVDNAIDEIKKAYRGNVFPHMRVSWKTYPDNIGHIISKGCYRCHDGNHINQRGERIAHDCELCHTFLNPVVESGRTALIEEGHFNHPMALEGPHAALRCDQCHDGGVTPLPTCAGCHTAQAAFRNGSLVGFESLSLPAEPMVKDVGCEDCHDLVAPAGTETINAACMSCHEDEEERFKDMLSTWDREVARLLTDAERRVQDDRGRRLLEALRKSGPLHNIEAIRAAVGSLGGEPAAPGAAQESP